jgi:hypothetical protein
MKKLITLFFALTILSQGFGQTDEEIINWPDEPLPIYQVIEIVPKPEYILEFINAVKAHNDKFHNKGNKTKAYMRRVIAGEKSDTFYWIEGPMTAEYFDKKEESPGREQAWNKNIGKYIDHFGESNFYREGTPFTTKPKYNGLPKYAKVWTMSFKEVDDVIGKTFKLAIKIKKAREAAGLTYAIYWGSEMIEKGWRIFIVETSNALGELYDSNVDLKGAFEKLYGADSFSKFWENWEQLVELESTELRLLVN